MCSSNIEDVFIWTKIVLVYPTVLIAALWDATL